jgi:beta-glucuronidase
VHIASRRKIALDGEWAFQVDPHDKGVSARLWECRSETPEGPPEDFDLSAFRKVRVPSDWNRQFTDLTYYEGVAWYHREVERPAGWAGKRAFLYFEAVNYHATVYWNGEELGRHEGGFTPFWFEVTGKLEHKNVLVIRVDAARRSDGLPGLRFDWFRYGGITRSAWFVLTSRVYVRDFSVRTEIAKKAVAAHVEFEVVGAKAGAHARVMIPELEREVHTKLRAGGRGKARVELERSHLWDPQHPRLYRVEVACEGDRIADDVGFRTFERKGQEVLLNGKRVFLRGVSLHEEAPRVAGRSLKERDIEYLFKTARSVGVNFLRLAHYPHTELMARTADRLGIMLWEEIPVYWNVDFKSRRTLALAKEMLGSLIFRDRNRPSVVLWSVANETPETPDRLRFLRALVKEAKRLDPTRPVTAAMFAKQTGRTATVKDPLARAVDVVGINEYFGWYWGKVADIPGLRWRSTAGRPVVISEFGAGARAGLMGKPSERWTEQFQAEVYGKQLDMIERIKFVRGTSPWIMMDFRSPHRQNRHQQGYNRKGLVSDQGARKLAFQVVRDRYEAWRKRWEK